MQLVVVYQPHQNLRQHDQFIQSGYKKCFDKADKIYWLPTYLSRENPDLPVLKPQEILEIAGHNQNPKFELAEFGDSLITKIQEHRKQGDLVLLLGAGSIDAWARENLAG